MKCITHQQSDAIGCCRWCGRGICTHCCVELPDGLACRERCEGDVKALGDYMRMAISKGGALNSFRAGARMALVFSFFFGVMGILMAMASWGSKDSGIVYGVESALFFIVSGATLRSSIRSRRTWK